MDVEKTSSLKLACGDTQSMLKTPQTHLLRDVLKAHEKRVARKFANGLRDDRALHFLDKEDLAMDTAVYFFRRDHKLENW